MKLPVCPPAAATEFCSSSTSTLSDPPFFFFRARRSSSACGTACCRLRHRSIRCRELGSGNAAGRGSTEDASDFLFLCRIRLDRSVGRQWEPAERWRMRGQARSRAWGRRRASIAAVPRAE